MSNTSTSKVTVAPVLADEYLRPVELVDFFAANVLDRQKTAEAIKLLSALHPLGQFQHLKRVRSTSGKNCPLQILLCPQHKVLDADSCNACQNLTSDQSIKCMDGLHQNAETSQKTNESPLKTSVLGHRETHVNIADASQNTHNSTSSCRQRTSLEEHGMLCSKRNHVLNQNKTTQSESSSSEESIAESCKEKDIFQLSVKDVTDSSLQQTRVDNNIISVLGCQVQAGLFSKPYMVKVPKYAPLTRKQFEESLVYWPVNFHEHKRVAKLLHGQFFSESDVNQIQSYLKEAAEMAKMARQKGQGSVGVVIVDPVKGTVICRGHSLTRENVLMHAAMVAVDLVAKTQGGGMWNVTDGDMYILPMEATTHEMTAADTMPVMISKEKTGPYLCTSYHVYMTEEPCPMCAMALLHSRVARVIYSQPHPDGALGSAYKLHTHPSLNHHFDVFCYTGNIHCDS